MCSHKNAVGDKQITNVSTRLGSQMLPMWVCIRFTTLNGVSSTNNGQVKWFRDNPSAHCQTHEIPWAPTHNTNSTIAHDANNHAMNTICMCNPKHSSNCIQVSGKANGKHPATTQTQINHNISETAHNTRPRKRCRKRTDPANAGTFRTCTFAFHLRALPR